MASSCVCRVGGRTFGLHHPFRAATTVGSLIRHNYSSVARNVAGKRSMAVALSPLNSRVRWLTTTLDNPPPAPTITISLDASATPAVPVDTSQEEKLTNVVAPVSQDLPQQGKNPAPTTTISLDASETPAVPLDTPQEEKLTNVVAPVSQDLPQQGKNPAPATTISLDASATPAVPIDTPQEEKLTNVVAPVGQDPPQQGKNPAQWRPKKKVHHNKKQQWQRKKLSPPPKRKLPKIKTNWIRVSNIPVMTSLEDVKISICNAIEEGLVLLGPDDFLSRNKSLSQQVEKEMKEPSNITDEEPKVENDASTNVLKEDNASSLDETMTASSDTTGVTPSLPPREKWIQSARLILSPYERPTGYYIFLKEIYLVSALLVLPKWQQPYCGGKELNVLPITNYPTAAAPKRNEASVRVEGCPGATEISHIRTLFGNYDVDYVEHIKIPGYIKSSLYNKSFVVQFASPAHARAAVRNLQGSLKLHHLDDNTNTQKPTFMPPDDPTVQRRGVILARFPQQMN
eukprot:scaffold111422_cov53-Attheya_sp.AAC.3